jgi:hypothetical protein
MNAPPFPVHGRARASAGTGSVRTGLAGLLASSLLLGAPAASTAQALGGEGESCQARSDCAEGLRCLGNVCTASTDAAAGPEPGPPAEPAPAEQTATAGGWSDFALGGAHGFVGLALGPALTGDWFYGGSPTWHPGMLLALRGGILLDRIELALEFAPVSLWWSFERDPVLSFNVTIGGLVELTDHLYWPFRFGLGVTGVNAPHDETYMQARLDLAGIVYQYGHLLFELDLISVRFSSEFRDFGLWAVPFVLAASYVF